MEFYDGYCEIRISSFCCDVLRVILGVEIALGSLLMLVYSYVAGEGVELTVRKESVVVEKIKEVGLRSHHAQLFMTNYN